MGFTDPTATSQTLKSILSSAVDGEGSVPNLAFRAVSKDGKPLFQHSVGVSSVATAATPSPKPLPDDSVYWMASCTKMVTALCCMQLVEKGILSLDDGEQLETLVPELKDRPVFKPDGTTEPKKRAITLRMLLTHTAGFGYSIFSEPITDWGRPAGLDEFSGDLEDFKQPLLFQPGEGWMYGGNLDWAGVALERATKTRLNDYMHENLFKPLRLEDISFLPTPSMKKRLVHMHQRHPDGTVSPTDHLIRRPLTVETKEVRDHLFHSGGAGLFSTLADYGRIISLLLNDGTCPVTGAVILAKATVDEMFTNHIPQFPDFGRQEFTSAKATLSNPLSELYPNGGLPQGHGLSFMITGSVLTERSAGTAWWAGLANLFWWADREKGVGGIVATQLLPFGDEKVLGSWFALEKTVYEGMK